MKKRICLLLILIFLMSVFGACKPSETEPSASPSVAPPTGGKNTAGPSETPIQSAKPVSQVPDTAETEVQENSSKQNYEVDGKYSKLKGDLYLSVPKISSNKYPENAAMINDYFDNLKAKYKEGFETELDDAAANENASGSAANRYLDVAFQTEYNSGGIISFYITEGAYTGGAHDMTTIRSETFDISKGARITAAELFSAKEEVYTRLIKDYIIKQMDIRAKEAESPYFDNYAELVEATYDKDNFVLTDNGLRVYFQIYDVAPFAAGSIQFDIPYSYLADVLNPAYGIRTKE